jgi:hypothetical protein
MHIDPGPVAQIGKYKLPVSLKGELVNCYKRWMPTLGTWAPVLTDWRVVMISCMAVLSSLSLLSPAQIIPL